VEATSPAPQLSNSPLEKLTPRQLEVLALLCEGLPNKLIARRMDITSGTVKVHIVQILRGLNVSSRLQAVLVARSPSFEFRPANVEPIRPGTFTAQRYPSGSRHAPDDSYASCLLATVMGGRLAAVAGSRERRAPVTIF
jgi:DNA-binding CsgD family transcriptional regulator